MERECEKCVYHTSGSCSQWRCNGTVTIDDIKADERREMADELAEKRIEFMVDKNEKCKCVDCFFRWLYKKGGAE